MVKRDPRVDAYIKKSQVFAKPILIHLRGLVHKVCPDVEETIKWQFPNFMYQGKVLCNMAAFKQHATFGFWRASLMTDPHKIFTKNEKTSMGQLGKITNLKDLPSDKIIVAYLKEAMELTDSGAKIAKKKSDPQRKIVVPFYLKKVLKMNAKAAKNFEAFSYSHKKEYVEWLEEAKTEETREKRLLTTVEWLTEGKNRNWKYERK